MRAVAQRVEKKNVQVAELGQRLLRDDAEIGEIGGGAEAVTINLRLAVHQPHRLKARTKELQGAVDLAQLHLRQRGVVGVGIKDVTKNRLDVLQRGFVSVERKFLRAAKTQGPDIVESHDVVGVGVRIDDRIEAAHTGAQRLLAEVGSGVNEHHAPAIFHQNGRTGAAIVRIGRITNFAGAAES